MKKITIILSILALIASSCGQATKKQEETIVNEQEEIKIEIGKIYTDTFEYVDYDGFYDYPYLLFIVKKDDQILTLIDDCPTSSTRTPNRGDIVEIQWKTDGTTKLAVNMKKIQDGKLSVFRKTNNKPRSYIFMENNQPEDYQTTLINEIEYFLANTTDENMIKYLNDEKGEIQIYISKYKRGADQKDYPIITARIDNYDGKEHTLIKLGIEFDSENYERIYYQFDEKRNEYIRIE